MFSVYILYSIAFQKSYVGQTNDLQKRLLEHNAIDNKGFTSKYKPWILVYSENFENRADAMKSEKYFKTGIGREKLKGIITEFLKLSQ